MLTEIGIYEAKTNFPAIARRSEEGESFLVKRNGKAVCKITPLSDDEDERERNRAADTAYERLKMNRRKLRDQGIIITNAEIKEWIEEGRRY